MYARLGEASPFVADPGDIAPGPAYQLPELTSVAKKPGPWLLYALVALVGYHYIVTGKAGRRRSLW